jgi:hypothetical protein
MAITATVYDLEGYSENSKTVTLDLLKVVPVGALGDEKFILTCRTNAYSDYTNKTSIDDIFIQEFLCGWCKSSGFKGAIFTINSGNKVLKVKIDGASKFYDIILDEGTNLTSDVVAADIQLKLRALTMETTDASKLLGYKNCICSFTNSRFVIKSGTIAKMLSGTSASMVEVDTSGTASGLLGFDLSVTSKSLAGTDIREVVLSGEYTAGTSTLSVEAGLGFSPGDSMCITASGSNTPGDYFTAISGTETAVEVATTAVHGFDGISSTYAVGSKVQKLKYNDPEYSPASCLLSVDDALTWGILSLANQIDFSG